MQNAIRIEVGARNLFAMPLRKVVVEDNEATGRIYFLDKAGRLLAVAKPKVRHQQEAA